MDADEEDGEAGDAAGAVGEDTERAGMRVVVAGVEDDVEAEAAVRGG